MTTGELHAYVGKVVYRRFPVRSQANDPAGGRCASEFMWVDVHGVDAGHLIGVLLNTPLLEVGYQRGDLVRFPASEVEKVDDGSADVTRVH